MSQLGVVAAGDVPFSVTAGRIQGATASRVTSASITLRPSGWGPAEFPLTRAANGQWRAVVNLPEFLQGSAVDVEVKVADQGGSTFDQTVSRAFVLGPANSSGTPATSTSGSRLGGPSAFQRAGVRDACSAARAGAVRCLSKWKAGAGPGALSRQHATARNAVGAPEQGYGPADIASAYGLDQAKPGQLVAIVDAYDNPKAAADLATYRKAFGLPACTVANGCFRKVNQRGGTKPPQGDVGWGVEIALDLQAVSAACPKCKILLVEADDASFESIGAAVNRAVTLGAKVVSNSYGADEGGWVFDVNTRFYDHPGVAMVASSGDFGFGPASFPAVMPNVIAVGGTTLSKTGSGWSEKAWGGSGSGCSAWVAKPSWQVDRHCSMRTVADVSAVADPETGLAVYDTYGLGPDNGWIVVGGTSLSAPLMSGMIAAAGNPASLATAQYIYTHRTGLHDVVGGSNGFCGGDYLCTGRVGYDAPTGWGSPRGYKAL